MLASIRGGGVEVGGGEDDVAEDGAANEGSDGMIAALLYNGASLGAQTEQTGKWQLRLKEIRCKL